MSLKRLQILQLLWVLLGLGFNVVSMCRLKEGVLPLSPTDPITGAIFVATCGLIIILGLTGFRRFYAYSILLFASMLAYSGVAIHLLAFQSNSNLPEYASYFSWLSAVLINIYGTVVLVAGGVAALRK